MKVLCDPVLTGKCHKCSTSYMFWDVIQHMAKERDDVFFYLLCPPATDLDDAELAFLTRMSDRVKLLPYPYIKADRIEEAFKLTDPMIRYLSPGDTPIWDYDAVLTSRVNQLPYMRNVAGREVANYPRGTQRCFIGLECMPIFSFRDTVSWAGGGHMDLQSLAAYQAANAVVVADLWTKREVIKVAREWLSPSRVVQLTAQVHEALPVKLERLAVDDPVRTPVDTLCVVFAGRMTGTRNFQEVAELFRNHASYPLAKDRKLRFVVSTNSMSTGSISAGELDCMEVQYNDREKFHALLKNEAHVVVNLSRVEDFSLSTYEPLLFGVPVIVPDEPWTSFLGDDYPFRAKDFAHAYYLVKEFANDHATMYQRFRDWEHHTWADLVASSRNVSTAETVSRLLRGHEEYLHRRLLESEGGQTYRDLVAGLVPDENGLARPLDHAHEQEYFLTNAKQWHGIPVGKRPCEWLLKIYANLAGWVDTLEPGVMRAP